MRVQHFDPTTNKYANAVITPVVAYENVTVSPVLPAHSAVSHTLVTSTRARLLLLPAVQRVDEQMFYRGNMNYGEFKGQLSYIFVFVLLLKSIVA